MGHVPPLAAELLAADSCGLMESQVSLRKPVDPGKLITLCGRPHSREYMDNTKLDLGFYKGGRGGKEEGHGQAREWADCN